MLAVALLLACSACLGHGTRGHLQPDWKISRESSSLKSVAAILLTATSPIAGHQVTPSSRPHAGSASTCRYGACGSLATLGHLRRQSVLRLRGGEVESVQTEAELDMELDEAGNALVVVDFYADWCGPCKKIAPVISALAKKTEKTGRVKFFKVNVDEARELAKSKKVEAMPTLLFYRKRKLVKKIVGGDIAGLKRFVAQATMNPLVRKLDALRNEKLLIAGAIAYLAVPWQRVLSEA
mmetsp:Transcript_104089/g.189591  ORF Transcript_104089/g.189591 Transcript_104089/m.189591 type:complete len:238 (+) Transcript_104089:55-768(+)